jgi:hypothetical protein
MYHLPFMGVNRMSGEKLATMAGAIRARFHGAERRCKALVFTPQERVA